MEKHVASLFQSPETAIRRGGPSCRECFLQTVRMMNITLELTLTILNFKGSALGYKVAASSWLSPLASTEVS